MIKIFFDRESEYQEWISNTPNGLVLTTTKVSNPDYMSLHRSSCHSISKYHKNHASDAFTGQNYMKVCSTEIEALHIWMSEQGGTEFQACGMCKPDVFSFNKTEQFFQRVKVSLSESNKRKQRLNNAPKHPEITITKTITHKRNPDVVAEVLERANGFCETCSKSAPFYRAKDGTPYLEVHHIIQLSIGGEDTVENAIALCPNCHREKHYG